MKAVTKNNRSKTKVSKESKPSPKSKAGSKAKTSAGAKRRPVRQAAGAKGTAAKETLGRMQDTAFDAVLQVSEAGYEPSANAEGFLRKPVRSMLDSGQNLLEVQSKCASKTLEGLARLASSRKSQDVTDNAAALWNASLTGCQDVVRAQLDLCRNLVSAWWQSSLQVGKAGKAAMAKR